MNLFIVITVIKFSLLLDDSENGEHVIPLKNTQYTLGLWK